MTKKLLFTIALLLGAAAATVAQNSPVGVWKTIDDETGEAKSHVEIYKADDGSYEGKITRLLRSPQDKKCAECPGDRKNKKLVGMVIVEDLKRTEDYWEKGEILDPESGNTYRCSVWFEDGKQDELQLRGYHWTGLYRTQTWYRLE
jgi:uncharacterized protein (DUF2147 family)